MLSPYLHVMERVELDIDQCLKFVRRQPWGKPNDRRLDIWDGIKTVLTRPEWFSVAALRRETGLELRRYNVAQFVIIYAYIPPTAHQPGVVSIRAVRHTRVKDVFAGVKEPVSAYGSAAASIFQSQETTMPDTNEKIAIQPPVERKRPAYDPNNLSTADMEARKYDDTSAGIDWDEIIATTQDDFLAGRFSYNLADYATKEEADAALKAWLDRIFEEWKRESGYVPSCDATG